MDSEITEEGVACLPEIERIVLGHMLTEPQSVKRCCQLCTETDFHVQDHRIIFRAIKKAYEANSGCGVAPVCSQLKSLGMLERLGGYSAVAGIAQLAATDLSVYLDDRLEQLKEQTLRRAIKKIVLEIEAKISTGGNAKDVILDAQEKFKAIEKDKGFKDKFPIRFLNEFGENFLTHAPQTKPMLLKMGQDGFLPKSIVAMLVGGGGVGKTHLLAQLAISVATGTNFLDTIKPTTDCGSEGRGNVFFGLGENQYDDIHRVLWKASKDIRSNGDLLNEASKRIAPFSFCGQQAAFLTPEGNPSRYFKELKMKLEDMAPDGGWQLIILDPVSRLLGVDAETDNAFATVFIALLEELTIDLPGNPTVLFAHHANKTALNDQGQQKQTAARGSSALTDGCRWQMNYFRQGDNGVLQMTKTNFTKYLSSINTRQDDDGFIRRSDATSAKIEAKPSFMKKEPDAGRYVNDD